MVGCRTQGSAVEDGEGISSYVYTTCCSHDTPTAPQSGHQYPHANNDHDNHFLSSANCCQIQEGSLAGMLRRVSGPLLHQYAMPAFQTGGPDLAWLCMTPADAQVYRSRLLGSINTANMALFGQLPDPPA
jgi:hypothetical protein